MPPAEIVQTLPPQAPKGPPSEKSGFGGLRSVRWRVNLGILPNSSSVGDLRRVTADARRRYAGLRRRLLIDPHVPKEGSNSPNLVMDNPLSENPDSSWGQFFRSAELEKMVDQDLSRLYPEHGNYFQTSGCQGVLRRILLLWCLTHPDYGYRQGMHELLAPLLYVLHVDTERLAQVRKLHEDHFIDKFDGLSFHENDLMYNFDLKKFSDSVEDEIGYPGNSMKSLDELDPEIQTIVLLSDAYGAEGELGVVLSEKFMEHDAYCMFDALMIGDGGAVAMADFFTPSPVGGCHTVLPPVIEASTAMYHLLSVVDSSLHSHLVELGVEPQYFALRWLRVLFGREFVLEDLLIIWDEIFAADNSKLEKAPEDDAGFRILVSHRGEYISAIAVSMILYLRSSLLATENATSCLKRLLNFPDNVDLKKLFEKAKSLKALALDINMSSSIPLISGPIGRSKAVIVRSSSDSAPTKTPIVPVNESYWEEKWRVLTKAEELKQSGSGKPAPTRKKGWTERVRLTLSRTRSDPSAAKAENGRKDTRSSIRRSLLEDLCRALGSEADNGKVEHCQVDHQNDHISGRVEEDSLGIDKNSTCTSEESQGDDKNSTCTSEESQGDDTNSTCALEESQGDDKNSTCALEESHGDDKNSNWALEESQGDDKNSTSALEESQGNDKNSTWALEESQGDDKNSTCTLEESQGDDKNSTCALEERRTSEMTGSDENSSIFSDPTSPLSNVRESESDGSTVGSIDENDMNPQTAREDLSDSVPSLPSEVSQNPGDNRGSAEKPVAGVKERTQVLLGKFQWLWKFGRHGAGEGTSEKGEKATNYEDDQSDGTGSFVSTGSCSHHSNAKGDAVDQNVMRTLRNLGQSMLEHIQVIESVFQQERGQAGLTEKNALVGKGQVTAVAALKELRKISNLLSEM